MPAMVLVAISTIVGLSFLMFMSDISVAGFSKADLFLLLPALAALFAVAAYLLICITYDHFTYEFTDKALVIRSGLVTRKTVLVPFSRIQDIRCERSLAERLIGIATVDIETAGSQVSDEIVLQGIANKDDFVQTLVASVESSRGAGDGISGDAHIPQTAHAYQLLAKMFEEMKQRSMRDENRAADEEGNGASGKLGDSRIVKEKEGAASRNMFEEYARFRFGRA